MKLGQEVTVDAVDRKSGEGEGEKGGRMDVGVGERE